MDEQPGLSDQYRMASPWPLFVALGLALSEVGIFMGLFPVAVGGLLLLGGSVSGILRESGYVARPWRTFAQLGGFFALLGVIVVGTQVDLVTAIGTDPLALMGTLLGVVERPSNYAVLGRGMAVVVAGLMMLAAGGTGSLMARSTPQP
ncbi:cox cluster protein [Haloarculaceae archaeon H-GB2-1]|nr:cox cluster protein [Haloarculaceae archaeon H-GB1-1]MEA5386101.1 cox cluster protein [Haloarculaceae archaeon H-GB11]MEA5407607.1 cox cluster protein [Haloarculaceae archaeon H-GB2-1]